MERQDTRENGGINLCNWNTRRAQIIVTYACNMNCSFCNNHEFATKDFEFIKVSDVMYFLEYLKYVEKIEEAIIVYRGGEPTLLPTKILKEIADLVHSFGYKSELYTNGLKDEEILELDGYIDYINISNYGCLLYPCSYFLLEHLEKSIITITKLINKQSFKTFKDFDKFVDEVNKEPFNYDFSTMPEYTPNFELYHPEWVEKELLPLCENQDVKGSTGAALYKGRLIKLPHMSLSREEDISTLKLYPNGNLSTIWKSSDIEIDYKEKVHQLLKKNN